MEIKFRKLKADEIDCRVKTVSESYIQLLLYKDARVDQNILDETVGPMNWQNDYKIVRDNMYCGIGIKDTDSKEWIWKWNCGVESNTEKEKGEASDSFKRAGFNWGIGRELYTSPKIAVAVDICGGVRKDGNFWKMNKPYMKFIVKEITYKDNGDIDKLIIVDSKGNVLWSNVH